MSFWTHIFGSIEVQVMGRTQEEEEYILKTVLKHLPRVTGSEGDMNVHIIQKAGYDYSSSTDEFGMNTNNLVTIHGTHNYKNGWLNTQSTYILTIEADLRDRCLSRTYREFQKWLCRLAKRLKVVDILVRMKGDYSETQILSDASIYTEMFVSPSWCEEGTNNWCEYLMWDRCYDSRVPLLLTDTYNTDDENAKREKEHRLAYNLYGEDECNIDVPYPLGTKLYIATRKNGIKIDKIRRWQKNHKGLFFSTNGTVYSVDAINSSNIFTDLCSAKNYMKNIYKK